MSLHLELDTATQKQVYEDKHIKLNKTWAHSGHTAKNICHVNSYLPGKCATEHILLFVTGSLMAKDDCK